MRIAMVTQRDVTDGFGQHPAYGVWAEAEDVLIAATDPDLVRVSIDIEHAGIRARRVLGRNLRRVRGAGTSVPAFGRAGGRGRPLSGRYDLLVFTAYSIWDLQHLERLRLRRFSDNIAVWFMESWPSSFLTGKVDLEPFHLVDHIFAGLERAIEPLSGRLGRSVTYLPMATDTLRFGPESPDAERPVDLIGIGRRHEHQHEAMLRWAEEHDRFYLYDTTRMGRPTHSTQHRDNIGRWYASSKLATCNYAKHQEPKIIDGLRIIPGRLFEGMAAGVGLIGLPPDPEAQRALFGRTVVEPVPDDLDDISDFLEEMRRHDWAHRWSTMFHHLGLPVPPRLDARIEELARRAEKFA